MSGERKNDERKILMPGEYYFGNDVQYVETILGSCIAITMWHPKKSLVGMCHYVLPLKLVDRSVTDLGRYGYLAMEALFNSAKAWSTDISEYRYGVYGGGNMFPCGRHKLESNIGDKNRDLALAVLNKYRLKISQQRTGGDLYRKIIMNCKTGLVNVIETSVGCAQVNKNG